MRVKGNAVPESIHIEAFGPCPGMVELRLRENIVQDEADGLYSYDEYVVKLADRPGLYEEVRNGQEAWFATARAMEGGENTSFAQVLRDGLETVIPGARSWQAMEMAQAFNREMQAALQLVFDGLNQGQQQKLMKQPPVKALLQRYGVGEGL